MPLCFEGFLLGDMKDWELLFTLLTPYTSDEDVSHGSSEMVTTNLHASVGVASDSHNMELDVSWTGLVPCLVGTLCPQEVIKLISAHPRTLLGRGGGRELHSLLLAAGALHTQQR